MKNEYYTDKSSWGERFTHSNYGCKHYSNSLGVSGLVLTNYRPVLITAQVDRKLNGRKNVSHTKQHKTIQISNVMVSFVDLNVFYYLVCAILFRLYSEDHLSLGRLIFVSTCLPELCLIY